MRLVLLGRVPLWVVLAIVAGICLLAMVLLILFRRGKR